MTPDESSTVPASQQSALIRRIIRLVPVLALDALLIIASYAAALALRFDGAIPRESMIFFGQVIVVTPIVSTSPLFTMLTAMVFGADRLTLKVVISVLIVVLGVMLVSLGRV